MTITGLSLRDEATLLGAAPKLRDACLLAARELTSYSPAHVAVLAALTAAGVPLPDARSAPSGQSASPRPAAPRAKRTPKAGASPGASLLAAVKKVAAFVEKASYSPILSCVLLAPDGRGGLRVRGTDKALDVTLDVPDVDYRGEAVAVDARDLLAALPGATRPEVRVTPGAEGHVPPDPPTYRLAVRGPGGERTLPAYPESEYPAAPKSPEGPPLELKVDAAALAAALRRLLPGVAPEDNHYGLNGIHIADMGDGTLRLVATDGNVLYWASLPYAGPAFSGGVGEPLYKQILPRRAVERLPAILDDVAGTVTLTFGTRAFTCGPVTGRMLEADFPDYRQVVPTSWAGSVLIDVEPLRAALKQAVKSAGDTCKTVTFRFADAEVTLSTHAVDRGDWSTTIPVDTLGTILPGWQPGEIGMNAAMMLRAVDASGAAHRVLWRLGKDALCPTSIRDAESDDATFFTVVMPLRIRGT